MATGPPAELNKKQKKQRIDPARLIMAQRKPPAEASFQAMTDRGNILKKS
jgi:hypothetical protein